MSPPGAVTAEQGRAAQAAEMPSPDRLASAVVAFVKAHPHAAVLEDGKVIFDLEHAQYAVTTEHGRCTLQLWSAERQLTRTIVEASARASALRLRTQRFGHTQTKLLELRADTIPRTPKRREPVRQQYLRRLKRVLAREFPDWHPEGFRVAMDLERSFGPAYARGLLVRGNEAWAVIGIGEAESQASIDGVLSLGILWLHTCRERGDGRRVLRGLRVVVPRGQGQLTLARLRWMNRNAAQWELWELAEQTEELALRDIEDQGNLSTRLVHLPDQAAARERFDGAIARVMSLVPDGQEERVEQRLRSTAELAFLLHGMEFARARISLAPGSFTQVLEIVVGQGAAQTVLTDGNETDVREHITELFARRNARAVANGRVLRSTSLPGRGIGTFTGRAVHARTAGLRDAGEPEIDRWAARERAMAAQSDPLFRAAPERWLESVLRENLAPLTRSLGPSPAVVAGAAQKEQFANDLDEDTRGNRADPSPRRPDFQDQPSSSSGRAHPACERVIARFDPRFVYSQVPAIAGAADRGMLDLLGVTADGRLAVLELKAADDLQMALQGLDYWIRVRHHHREAHDTKGDGNDLQRHGYFRDVELSPLPPRLYLVAPALHVHPATEIILRYVSPEVEWTLLALDERWRQEVRVVWRKSGGRSFGQG